MVYLAIGSFSRVYPGMQSASSYLTIVASATQSAAQIFDTSTLRLCIHKSHYISFTFSAQELLKLKLTEMIQVVLPTQTQ